MRDQNRIFGCLVVTALLAPTVVTGCFRAHSAEGERGHEYDSEYGSGYDLYRARSCAADPAGDPSTLLTLSVDYTATRIWETDGSAEPRVLYATEERFSDWNYSDVSLSPNGRFLTVYFSSDAGFVRIVVDLVEGTTYDLYEEHRRRYGNVEELNIWLDFRPDSRAMLVRFYSEGDFTDPQVVEIDLFTHEWLEIDTRCGPVRYTRDGSCRIYRRRSGCRGHPVEIIDVDRRVVNALEDHVAYMLPEQRGAVGFGGDNGFCWHAPGVDAPSQAVDHEFCYPLPHITRDGRLGLAWVEEDRIVLDFQRLEVAPLLGCRSGWARLSPAGDRVACRVYNETRLRSTADIISFAEDGVEARLRLSAERDEYGGVVDAFSHDGRRYLLEDGLTGEERSALGPVNGRRAPPSEYAVYSTEDGRLLQRIPPSTDFGVSVWTVFRYPGRRTWP